MPKIRAVLYADGHEQTGDRQIDSFYAFEQIVDFALANNVKRVIGAGDLIDKQRNRSSPIAHMMQQIDRLEHDGIAFLYLQGQHDFDDPPWLSGHRNAQHINGQEFDIPNGSEPFRCYGLDWQPHGVLQEKLELIRETDAQILFAHQVWGDWMGDVAVPQGTFDQIPQVTKLVTGDLHQCRIENSRGADDQKLLVCSPGCTYQKAIDEPSTHYFLTLDSDGKIAKHKLKSRPFLDLAIPRAEVLDEFAGLIETELAACAGRAAAQNMPDALGVPLLRITYPYELPDTVRRVETIVGNRAILFWHENPPVHKQEEYAAAKKSGGKGTAVTPLTELPSVVDAEKEPDLYTLLHGLLSTKNADQARGVLTQWKASYLEQGDGQTVEALPNDS
jgi:hypothetical protein